MSSFHTGPLFETVAGHLPAETATTIGSVRSLYVRLSIMKKIEAIIRPDRVSDVCTELDNLGHHGVTLSQVEEQGGQKGWVNQVRGISHTVNLLSKVRVDVVVKDEEVERIIHAIREVAMTGEVGDGMLFIHDMADAIRIRTGESGMAAI